MTGRLCKQYHKVLSYLILTKQSPIRFAKPNSSRPPFTLQAHKHVQRQTNTQQTRSERKKPTSDLKQNVSGQGESKGGHVRFLHAAHDAAQINPHSEPGSGRLCSGMHCSASCIERKQGTRQDVPRSGPSRPDIQARSLFLFPSECPKS